MAATSVPSTLHLAVPLSTRRSRCYRLATILQPCRVFPALVAARHSSIESFQCTGWQFFQFTECSSDSKIFHSNVRTDRVVWHIFYGKYLMRLHRWPSIPMLYNVFQSVSHCIKSYLFRWSFYNLVGELSTSCDMTS